MYCSLNVFAIIWAMDDKMDAEEEQRVFDSVPNKPSFAAPNVNSLMTWKNGKRRLGTTDGLFSFYTSDALVHMNLQCLIHQHQWFVMQL